MRVLRVLFGFIKVGLCGYEFLAEFFSDIRARRRLRLGGNSYGVRSYISYERDVSVGGFNALV